MYIVYPQNIFCNINFRCEEDQKAERQKCISKCSDALCEDRCNTEYNNNNMKCPCHTECPNGCACPAENLLGNRSAEFISRSKDFPIFIHIYV